MVEDILQKLGRHKTLVNNGIWTINHNLWFGRISSAIKSSSFGGYCTPEWSEDCDLFFWSVEI